MINFKNKTILLTGGTGSWGNAICERLLKYEPKEIRIFARNENNHVQMQRKFQNKKIQHYIGDIRDFKAINNACKKVNYIFHLAAQKHVPICEEFPYEAIKTNILGTENIIMASISNKVQKVIDVSSDKAVAANNLYGLTKAIGEKLFLNASSQANINTKFCCIRSGNAMGTNGSVIPLFIEQIKTKNEVSITHKSMTRFFLTLPSIIELLFTAISSHLNGAIFVVKMSSCRIIDMVEVLIEHYGNAKTKIKEIGIRQGEKIHEVLISENESRSSYIYNKNYYVYFPDYRKCNLPFLHGNEFSSNSALLPKNEIKKMLFNGGFLK